MKFRLYPDCQLVRGRSRDVESLPDSFFPSMIQE